MSHQSQVTISDIKGNFYGGLPYSINWSFNGGEEPSSLDIQVVSKDGNYSTPKLNFQPQSVQFGNFTFNGYLTSYSFKKSPSQKTLELKYTDLSMDLNRYYVALNKKHGDKATNKYSRLILVGKEYHPCDTNLDSMLEYSETDKRVILDNCDPCPFMPEDKFDKACDPVLKSFEIFEVYYTFNELIDKISKIFTTKTNNIKINSSFKAQHTGVLKDVLSNWCSDLGLAYFWDPITNSLNFINRKVKIEIPGPPNDIRVIELNTGKSINNTFSRGFIGTFEKEAQLNKSYQCDITTKEVLKCLTVSDLYDDQKTSSTNNSDVEFESDVRELRAAISYLGKEARTAFLWFWLYGNVDATALKTRIVSLDSKTGQNDNSGSLIMPDLGDMKILRVLDAYGNDADKSDFVRCKNRLSQADRDVLTNEDKQRKREDTDPSYYFFIAEVNEETADKQLESDKNLANNFLGKFWYKDFKVTIAGANNNNSQVTIESPEEEGNAQWYKIDSDLESLPIFDFGHRPNSLVGKLVKNISDKEKENEKIMDSARSAAKNFSKSPSTARSLNSFMLLQRNAKWFIPPYGGEDALKTYEKLFKWYEDVSPKAFDSEGRPDFLMTLYPQAKENKNIKLFIARDLKGSQYPKFTVKFQKALHPSEAKFRKQKVVEEEDIFGNTVRINQGKWGLNKANCMQIQLPGITFYAPVQCFGSSKLKSNNPQPASPIGGNNNIADDGDEGFTVFVKSSATFKKTLPKLQYVHTIYPTETKTAKIDFILKDIHEDNLAIMNKNRCIVAKEDFNTYANILSENSSYSMSEAQDSMDFKMPGIFPLVYSVSQGLTSIGIEVSDGGVFTTYNFEDQIIRPPSEQYLTQYLKDLFKPKKTLGYLTPYSPDELRSALNSLGKV